MAYIESEKLELKVQYTTEIKKEIVAFLNSDGGTLIIGVDDNGKVIGVDNAKDIIERISLMIHEAIKPDASLICSPVALLTMVFGMAFGKMVNT